MTKKTDSLTAIEKKVLDILLLLMGIHSEILREWKESGMPQIPTYQLKAIAAFRSKRNDTVGALSKNAFVNKSSMSEMIKRLEKGRLVQRKRNPHNQREVQVSLTAQGVTLQKKLAQTRSRKLRQTFSMLDINDQTALVQALDTAYEIIQKVTKFQKTPL